MDGLAGEDQMRALCTAYPHQAGALFTSFRDLMLSQQWHGLRLYDLKSGNWAVMFGQKTVDDPIRLILPLPIDSSELTPAKLKTIYRALSTLSEDDLPPCIPSPLAKVEGSAPSTENNEDAPAAEPSSDTKDLSMAGKLDQESIYISIATPDSSVVYYKLSKGIKKPHDVPDE